jgi:hypothetical protein
MSMICIRHLKSLIYLANTISIWISIHNTHQSEDGDILNSVNMESVDADPVFTDPAMPLLVVYASSNRYLNCDITIEIRKYKILKSELAY